MSKIKKFQKPIDIDAHLKYRCPNQSCGQDHWISLLQAQTKNFRIVCYCGIVFRPKRIAKVRVKYAEQIIKTKQTQTNTKSNNNNIPQQLLDKCSDALIDYGFTKQEAVNLISRTYIINQTDNHLELIKLALQSLGDING